MSRHVRIVSPTTRKRVYSTTRSHKLALAMYLVRVVNNAQFAQFESTEFYVSPDSTVFIPVTYLYGSDQTYISSSTGTVSASGITISSVNSDIDVIVSPTKCIVNVSNMTSGIVSSVVPESTTLNFNETATFTLTYSGSYTADDIEVNVGTISGTTYTVPASPTGLVAATIQSSGYTFFKLDITALRDTYGENIFQLSEMELYTSNNEKIPLSLVTGTPGTSSSWGNEDPDNMFDGSTATKWCVRDNTEFVICRTPTPVLPAYYRLATANDTAEYPGRSPKDWTLCGAKVEVTTRDSGDWIVLDNRVNDTTFQAVSTTYFTFNIP